MPINDGIYTELTFDDALTDIIDNAPDSIIFAPGNPPELVLANMFAEARVKVDTLIGETLAALMSPVGAMIDLQNPNNPRRLATKTIGTLKIVNTSGSPQTINPDTVFTASTGQQYIFGVSSLVLTAGGTGYASVTAVDAGIGGNIPANRTFTAAGYSDLTITNPVMWSNGCDAESDARYYQRVTLAKTEYGSQVSSVAAENELKAIYPAARIYANKSVVAESTPVPVPGNGYNCVVMTPNGIYENVAVMSEIFTILSNRFEFVNSQNTGDARHVVMSGTVYVSAVPQSYYYTVAQNVEATITATINVRFTNGTHATERASQAVDFAAFFIERLMSYLSGVDGTTNVTYIDADDVSTVIPVTIAADLGAIDPIAPAFGIAAIRDLVSDASTRSITPQLIYDSTTVLELIMNPNVAGEPSVTMSLDSGGVTFIDFRADALFTDGTSWFDRSMSLDPSKISITVVDVS
jgi:hypothetical protein